MSRSLVIRKSFLRKERQRYAYWQMALFREMFQNAYDAKSTLIDVTLSENNGVCEIIFKDNGPGMDLNTLENVFFVMGESTKTGGDETGGFGIARMLICFSMDRYEIMTRNVHIVGDGGVYDVYELAEPVAGCIFKLYDSTTTLKALEAGLHQFLSHSEYDITVRVNGVVWTAFEKVGKLTRRLGDPRNPGEAFCDAYVNEKSDLLGTLIVRVNGSMMFRTSISAKACVVLNLHPQKSRDVLINNRDGMHWDYSNVYNSYVNELASNTREALKPKYKRKDVHVQAGGFQKVTRKIPQISAQNISAGLALVAAAGVDKPMTEGTKTSSGQALTSTRADAATRKLLPFDIIIDDQATDPVIRKIIDRYNPLNWESVFVERNESYFVRGGNIRKLLLVWNICVTHAVECFIKIYKSREMSYTVGWHFGDYDALCKTFSEGHVFFLNPVDKAGKLRFSIRDKHDLKKLMAFAKHEVAHARFSYHDEDFSWLQTEIDVYYDEKMVYRHIASFLKEDNAS